MFPLTRRQPRIIHKHRDTNGAFTPRDREDCPPPPLTDRPSEASHGTTRPGLVPTVWIVTLNPSQWEKRGIWVFLERCPANLAVIVSQEINSLSKSVRW